MPECICGHGPRSHYEYFNDGGGCVHCHDCMHFRLEEPEFDHLGRDLATRERDERYDSD